MMLTAPQVRRIQEALTDIADGPGYGELRLIVQRGRLRRIQTVRSEWMDEPNHADPAPPQDSRRVWRAPPAG